jgi:hypothetical protein
MACGLLVVVNPVGVNAEVLAASPVGFGAGTKDDWGQSSNLAPPQPPSHVGNEQAGPGISRKSLQRGADAATRSNLQS